MKFTCGNLILSVLLWIVSLPEIRAQSLSASRSSAQALDALLQDYAYRAFHRPRTGVVYDGRPPSNFSGINISVMRLRRGSLKSWGVPRYKEFEIPVGVVEQPYVERLALVYQNLGNWSSLYYPLPGYSFLAPVLGLLAYDAANTSATNLPKVDINATRQPISIYFTNVRTVSSGLTARCVWFDLDGLPKFSDVLSGNICSTFRQGHFSIVVESIAPAPAPSFPLNPSPGGGLIPSHGHNNRSRAWKIAVPVVGGFFALVLLGFLALWMKRYRQNKKISAMERQAEVGEALQMTSIGNVRAPVAMGTRTPPILENEYVP